MSSVYSISRVSFACTNRSSDLQHLELEDLLLAEEGAEGMATEEDTSEPKKENKRLLEKLCCDNSYSSSCCLSLSLICRCEEMTANESVCE